MNASDLDFSVLAPLGFTTAAAMGVLLLEAAIGVDQGQACGHEITPAVQIEAEISDVGAPLGIDHHVIAMKAGHL